MTEELQQLLEKIQHDGVEKANAEAEKMLADAKAKAQAILDLLSDGKPHHITELRDIQLPTDSLNAALEYLLKEEYIHQEDGFIASV